MTRTERSLEPSSLHEVKVWPEHFTELWCYAKRYEVRPDDRGYRVHDDLRLNEYDPRGTGYTGRWIEARITHVLRDFVGIAPGYVVLGLADYHETGGDAVAPSPPSLCPTCEGKGCWACAQTGKVLPHNVVLPREPYTFAECAPDPEEGFCDHCGVANPTDPTIVGDEQFCGDANACWTRYRSRKDRRRQDHHDTY